jgi:hypothetical protein
VTSQRTTSRQQSVHRAPQSRAANSATAAAPAVKFVEALGDRSEAVAAPKQPAVTTAQAPAQSAAAATQTGDVPQAPDEMPAPQVTLLTRMGGSMVFRHGSPAEIGLLMHVAKPQARISPFAAVSKTPPEGSSPEGGSPGASRPDITGRESLTHVGLLPLLIVCLRFGQSGFMFVCGSSTRAIGGPSSHKEPRRGKLNIQCTLPGLRSCRGALQASVDSQSSVGPVPQSGVRDLEKAGHSLHGEKAARRQVGLSIKVSGSAGCSFCVFFFWNVCCASLPADAGQTLLMACTVHGI